MSSLCVWDACNNAGDWVRTRSVVRHCHYTRHRATTARDIGRNAPSITNGVWTAERGNVIQSYRKANPFGKPFCCNTCKVNSHMTYPAHAAPLPCRVAKDLDCLSHLIYTVRPCLIHTYHAMPMLRPCRAPTMPFWKRLLKATAQHSRRGGMGTARVK
jgi:hypothetical protein